MSSVKFSDKKQTIGGAARDLVKLFSAEDSTLGKVENIVKSIEDIKADAESNLELELKIKSWLDKNVDSQEVLLHYHGSYPELYPEPRQTEYMDVLSGSWETMERWSMEMSKFDYVFPGWWEFLIPSRADGSSFNQLHVPRDRARLRSSKTHL